MITERSASLDHGLAATSPGMSGDLDSPVWAALREADPRFVEGGARALRYLPDVAPFAGVADRTAASFAALAALVPGDERVMLVTKDALAPPVGFDVELQKPILQMVLGAPPAPVPDGPGQVLLGHADAAEMVELAGRTRPGPFGTGTVALGRYIGLRRDGRLVAMAGERMRFGRFVEVSAVCVDPACRGQGHAGLLVTHLVRSICDQGQTPFLHVFADNCGAIALYEKLGFAVRGPLFVTVVRARRR